MKIIYYIILVLFIACPLIYTQNQAPVTTQEIDELKTAIQALLQKKYSTQKYSTQKAQIASLNDHFERLNEVSDMPLSRPEADQIKRDLDQLK